MESLAALEVKVFVFILWCCAFVFLGQKYVPAASPPDSPQGPGVRHLVTSPNSQGTKPERANTKTKKLPVLLSRLLFPKTHISPC